MELAQDKIDLIERIIKNDRKYLSNEDLYDDFFNETCKRSLMIIQTVSSDVTLESYLKKVAATSILNVLKNEGRLRRAGGGYQASKNLSLDDENSWSKINVEYKAADIPETPEDLAVKKNILQCIVDSVYEVNERFPEKNYLKLYHLRYRKGLTQAEIAYEMDISQSEVSKRLFKLMNEVKKTFNN